MFLPGYSLEFRSPYFKPNRVLLEQLQWVDINQITCKKSYNKLDVILFFVVLL